MSVGDKFQQKNQLEEDLEAKRLPEPLPLETLFHKYGIERSHADNVTRNALELFDILKAYHGLEEHLRSFVEIAALVHDIGVATDLENHHKAGKDILLVHPPSELSNGLQAAIPWIAFLHRKRVGEEKLTKLQGKAFGKMPETLQDVTLKVSALVRLADALDYSRMESKFGKIKFGKKNVMFEIKGEGAVVDAERMNKKSDLWHLLYDTKLGFRPEIKKP